ncbi:MAG: stage II sporulation protein M, partial [Actinobacteria bacterium]
MDLDAYVCEHAGQWRRLEHLTRKRRLAPPEVDELISLYQRTGTHLSVIRSRSPDPALVARLSRIVLAARGAITGGSAFSWRSVGRFFTATFPLAVLQAWRWWAAVGVAFTGLASLMMYYVAAHPDVQAAFLSDADIKQIVDLDFAGYYAANQAQNFALQVWTNNAYLAGKCLAAGVLILPVIYLLAQNLFNLGLVGGVMIGNGRSAEFFGLIAPHGMLELTAVFVASGVGLRIGWAWI